MSNRLSVNVSASTADAFRTVIARKGISIAEGVRRAIHIWRFIEDEIADGSTILIESADGSRRELQLVDDPCMTAARKTFGGTR